MLAMVNKPSLESTGEGVERGDERESLGNENVDAELAIIKTPSRGESMESGGECCVEWVEWSDGIERSETPLSV